MKMYFFLMSNFVLVGLMLISFFVLQISKYYFYLGIYIFKNYIFNLFIYYLYISNIYILVILMVYFNQ